MRKSAIRICPAGIRILEAQYRQIQGYTITFDAGEGHTIKNTTSQTDTCLTTPDGKLSTYPKAESPDKKENFEGWYTGYGDRVDNNPDYVFTGDMTLFAEWSRNATITIH